MELIGAAHGMVLNNPDLRDGFIRDSEHFRPPQPKWERNFRFRHWLALALHGLASRVDPTVRAPELLPRDAAITAVGDLP